MSLLRFTVGFWKNRWDYWSLWSGGLMLHKIFSAALGVLSACAGLVALVEYAYRAAQDLLPVSPDVVIYGRASVAVRILAVLIIWSLSAGALYMAFRLLRSALVPRKP